MRPTETICILSLYLTFVIVADCSLLFPDEDVSKTAAELIASKGYPVEEHYVTTEDLYVIMLQRIPAGRRETLWERKRRKPVVLLMSGLLASSADFVVNMPDQSLGFILADHGFDVWLGNVRGTKHSNHLIFKKSNRMFWGFSIDEMIKYDLPVQINYVLSKTGQPSLQYVGWSQGSAILFGLLAERPQYNKKVSLFHAMAPAVFLGHMKSALRLLIPYSSPIMRAAEFIFNGALLGKRDIIFNAVKKISCGGRKPMLSCLTCFYILNGGMPVEANMTRLPVYLGNTPEGTSVRNIRHFAQLSKSNRFQKFDFGRRKNNKLYGKAWPPVYDLRRVTTPVAIYYGDRDFMVTPRDVEHLVNTLPNVVLVYKVPVKGFTHIDFAWSINARYHLYNKILQMMTLANYQSNRNAPRPLLGTN